MALAGRAAPAVLLFFSCSHQSYSLLLPYSSVSTRQGANLCHHSIPRAARSLWKVNFLLPGAEYERALGRFSTVNVNPYFGLGYSSNFLLGDAWSVQPSLDVQLRRYYNIEKVLCFHSIV